MQHRMTQEEIARIAAMGAQYDALEGGQKISGARGSTATRPMDAMRRKPIVTELVKQGIGFLTDQSGNHEVRLDWHLNEHADKDKVFKLTVDDKEVYIDMEELIYYTRVMFVK